MPKTQRIKKALAPRTTLEAQQLGTRSLSGPELAKYTPKKVEAMLAEANVNS